MCKRKKTQIKEIKDVARTGDDIAPFKFNKEGIPTISRTESRLGHIFRDAEGHINPNTLQSQERSITLFKNVVGTPGNSNTNVLNNFQKGNPIFKGFSQKFNNGQVWVVTRDGEIINAGVNLIGK